MISRDGVCLLLVGLTFAASQSPGDVRRLLGAGRQLRALGRSADEDARRSVFLTDPRPLVLAQVIREMGGGDRGLCHVLIYYDPETAPPEAVDALRKAVDVPLTLVDVSKLRFPLITKTRRRVPLLDLLSARADGRCRLLVGWASSNYQRGLLLIARAEPGVLGLRDTLILPVSSQRLDRFMPQLRQRVLVKERRSRGGRGRRELQPTRFLVERTCETCARYSLRRLGEWQFPGGWEWGGVAERNPKLTGVELTVAYTPSVPNIFWVSGDGRPRLEGVELRLLDYAAQALNFTYRLVVPEDGEWGRPLNGTWTGKVGEVVYGRADVAVGGLVFTAEREAAAKYSILFHNELWGIVCPLSARLPVWPYVMFPFREDSAPSVFTMLVVLHVMAYLVGTLLGAHAGAAPQHPLTESVTRAVRTGVSLYLRLMACLYFWNLFYCLMKPKYEPPIDSSLALLRSGRRWGIVSGTTVTSVLSTAQQVAHQDLAANAVPLGSIREGFLKLRQDALCLVGVPKRYARATIAMRYTTECGEPGLQVSDEDLHSVLGGWVLNRRSPLTPHVNGIIRRLEGFGLLEHWRRQMQELLITRGPRDLPCLNPPLAALSLPDLRLAFVVLLAGWGLGCLLFLAEQIAFACSSHAGARRVVRRDTGISAVVPLAPGRGPRRDLRRWLQGLLTPLPSLALDDKEAVFRRHLDTILRDMWGVKFP